MTAPYDNVKFTHFLAYVTFEGTMSDGAIFGLGRTRAECSTDARKWHDDSLDGLEIMPATEAAYEHVRLHGGDAYGFHYTCYGVELDDSRES